MNAKLKKTLAVGLTALILSGIGGASLFASTNDSSANKEASSITEKQTKDNCKREPNFSDAISKGIIDEATATRMAEFLESNRDHTKKGIDMFADLISAGIINENQATKLKEMRTERDHKNMEVANFNDAVSKGSIDEATATKIVEFLESNRDNAKKETDMFADLVSVGMITADQAIQLKDNGPQMNR